jgi:lipoate-protein ligase A
MESWRWINSNWADGASHMATDQAMLDLANRIARPTMRVYRWRPYCISLGYHQKEKRIDMDRCGQDGIDVVRRPTGGRAVFHAEELTYSVVIPRNSDAFSTKLERVYNTISRGLANGIQKLGVPARLQKRSMDLRNHYKTSISVSCFSSSARHEIMLLGKKLVGSAQRQLPNGLLQHGSILTGRAHLNLTDYLAGADEDSADRMKSLIENKTLSIGEYLKRTVSYHEVAKAIRTGMEEELSICFVEEELSEQEKSRIEERYQNFSIFSGRMIPLPEESFRRAVS